MQTTFGQPISTPNGLPEVIKTAGCGGGNNFLSEMYKLYAEVTHFDKYG